MISIIRASEEDIPRIQAMAQVVFRHTYKSIITPEQMEFMIDWMYSEDSLHEQICGEGKAFFIAEEDGVPRGYVSYERQGSTPDGSPLFHLQKIYVMPDQQGKGIGAQLFKHVIQSIRDICPEPFRVELNVNRNNPAVAFYQKMGMKCDRTGDFPIGGGFYMNDFIYAIDIL